MGGMQSAAVIHWGGKREGGREEGSHVISQCCFGCIATGLSISPSVGGGGAVVCGISLLIKVLNTWPNVSHCNQDRLLLEIVTYFLAAYRQD